MSELQVCDKSVFRALAGRIYDLDADVYRALGSSLGRVFGADRDRSVNELAALLAAHLLGEE